MSRSFLFLIFYLSLIYLSFGQTGSAKRSKWPYFGENVPRYVAISGAYEGLKTSNFQVGLQTNVMQLTVSPAVGGMVGGGLFYKQNMYLKHVYSYEAEFGFYGGLVLGINYNYNVTSVSQIQGLKPFVGIAVFNAQLFYGYSFYKSKDDINNELRHNRITFRYVIPFIKVGK